jgi:hypothetical protein
MRIINQQPGQSNLGDVLINELRNEHEWLGIMAAFAKNSGVLRLKDAILDFRKKSGKVSAFIGIDVRTCFLLPFGMIDFCSIVFRRPSTGFSSRFGINHFPLFLIAMIRAFAHNNWTLLFEIPHLFAYSLTERYSFICLSPKSMLKIHAILSHKTNNIHIKFSSHQFNFRIKHKAGTVLFGSYCLTVDPLVSFVPIYSYFIGCPFVRNGCGQIFLSNFCE